MKRLLIFSFFCVFIFSCSKNESNQSNDNNERVDSLGNASNSAQEQKYLTVEQELKLNSKNLLLTESGTSWKINKIESTSAKDKTKITQIFVLKSDKKQTINFKDGLQHLEKSKCESLNEIEIHATLKVSSAITTSKYSEIQNLMLQPNQNLTLTLEINNVSNCQAFSFEFGVLSSEVLISETDEITEQPKKQTTELSKEELEQPQVSAKIEESPKEIWIIDIAEEIAEISDLNSSEFPRYVYKHRTKNSSVFNPNNKLEEFTTYTYTIDKSLELQCTLKSNINDTSGLSKAKCQMKIIPEFASESIKIVRGTDNKSNLVSIDITNEKKIQELCLSQLPIISSNEKYEVLNADGSKTEIPRLKLTCKYDYGEKNNFANFQGVLSSRD